MVQERVLPRVDLPDGPERGDRISVFGAERSDYVVGGTRRRSCHGVDEANFRSCALDAQHCAQNPLFKGCSASSAGVEIPCCHADLESADEKKDKADGKRAKRQSEFKDVAYVADYKGEGGNCPEHEIDAPTCEEESAAELSGYFFRGVGRRATVGLFHGAVHKRCRDT